MKKFPPVAIGYAGIITSGFFYASYGVWSKFMSGTFGEFNQAWLRAMLALLILIPFGLLTRAFSPIKKQDWIWFCLIAFGGGLNQAPYFYGYEHLEVGTGTLLFYMTLVLGTFILGKFFFQEILTPVKVASLALGVAGLGIIYKFVLTPDQIVPALSIILAALMGAAAIVFTKKLSSHYSKTQILASFLVVMLPTNFILSWLVGESVPSLALNVAWLSFFTYLIVYFLSNILAIVGFKYLEPSIAGLVGLLEVVFGVLLGLVIFGETLTTSLVIGSAVIILAAALPDLVRVMEKSSR